MSLDLPETLCTCSEIYYLPSGTLGGRSTVFNFGKIPLGRILSGSSGRLNGTTGVVGAWMKVVKAKIKPPVSAYFI